MKTVLVFGTFDVIHPGHVSFLKQARSQGDRLVASIARDDFVKRIKGRKPMHGEEERLSHILEIGLVDEAYLSDPVTGTYSLVKRLKPDVVCFGHDQGALRKNMMDWLGKNCVSLETVTLSPYRPEMYKSSRLNKSGGREK